MGHTVTAAGWRWGVPARIVALQLAATVLVAAAGLWWSQSAALSALLGGVAVFVPNACFAFWLGRGEAGADAAGATRAAAALFGQWLAKLGLTVALLLGVVVAIEVVPAAFVAGLAVTLLAPLAMPWTGGQRRGGASGR